MSESTSLPTESLMYIMLTPILYLQLFQNISWIVLLTSWIIIILCIAVCMGVFNAYNTIYTFVLYVPISFFLLYKTHTDRYNSLLEKASYEAKILDIQTQSEQNSREIKNMLSNVTHDMKTVRN
jgi:hypothetical protein